MSGARPRRPKIALVAQRFGPGVVGGAEDHARLIARLLSRWSDLTVVTTCARDYLTWANHFAPGRDQVDGLPVLRFANLQQRDVATFPALTEQLLLRDHPYGAELEWLKAQGPRCPELLWYLRAEGASYDLLLFFTYLYYPTFFGLQLHPRRSALVPTAHNEPAIYLNCYQHFFRLPAAIFYNTVEEKGLLNRLTHNQFTFSRVVGVGMDPPGAADVAGFRRAYGLERPYLIYAGRITTAKGTDTLLRCFAEYRAGRGDGLELVLIGATEGSEPQGDGVRYLGFLSSEHKDAAFAGAAAMAVPSLYESLSIVALEAWRWGRPVLADRRSEVLAGLIRRSGGGWTFGTAAEFGAALGTIVDEPEEARRRGELGRRFVTRYYNWPTIERKYAEVISRITGIPCGPLVQ
ncbi:MAG TPA: glycosyltransferase family 4 protein [Acidobacteriota bacterium]